MDLEVRIMFDRNVFKDSVRMYLAAHPQATEEDVVDYCRKLIPAHCIATEYWLVDQCLQWFRWLQTQPGRSGFGSGSLSQDSRTFEEDPH